MSNYFDFCHSYIKQKQKKKEVLALKTNWVKSVNDQIYFHYYMFDSTSKYQRLETDQNGGHNIRQSRVYLYDKNSQSCPKLSLNLLKSPDNQISLPQFSTRRCRNSTEERLLDPIDRNMIKNVLKNSYEQQIQRQQERKKEERRTKIMQEQDYLSRFQNPEQFILQQKKKRQEQYKHQLLDEIQQKKILVNHVKTQQTAFAKKCQGPKNHHLSHKCQAFLEFYDEALKHQKNIERQYKGYMKEEEKYIKARNKDKLMDYKQNFDLMEHHSQQVDKLNQDKQLNFRKILNEQIHEGSQSKKKSRQSSRRQKRYTEVYNPISNPINNRIDPKNRYIAQQILKATPRRQLNHK